MCVCTPGACPSVCAEISSVTAGLLGGCQQIKLKSPKHRPFDFAAFTPDCQRPQDWGSVCILTRMHTCAHPLLVTFTKALCANDSGCCRPSKDTAEHGPTHRPDVTATQTCRRWFILLFREWLLQRRVHEDGRADAWRSSSAKSHLQEIKLDQMTRAFRPSLQSCFLRELRIGMRCNYVSEKMNTRPV